MMTGWHLKRLGDFVCSVSTGPFGSLLHKSDYVDHGVPLVNPINIVGSRIIPNELKLIDETTKRRLGSYVLEEGDIVVGRRGEIGRCAVIGPEESGWVCGTGCFFIRPSPSIDPYFLAHLIRADRYRDQLERSSTGTTMKNLSNTVLGDLMIAVPPLTVQQGIVSILDEAFDGISAAAANAEKNRANAHELFDIYHHAAFNRRDKGWTTKRLGDVCEFVRGPFGGSLKKSIFVADGYAVYEQQHAICDDFDDVRYFIDEKKFNEMKRFELLPNDLIMSCSGTMGRVAIVPEGIRRGIINQALLKLTPNATVSGVFLRSWMESQAFQDALREYSGGAAIQNVASVKILKEIVIPLPSMREQRRLLEALDEVRDETERLEAIYQRKLASLAELKRSILQKAFSGELTADPERLLQEALA